MRLTRRQFRVYIIKISTKRRIWHLFRERGVQPVYEAEFGGKGFISAGHVAVMLYHPEGLAVAVCRGVGERGVDYAAGPAVEVDDAKPGRWLLGG